MYSAVQTGNDLRFLLLASRVGWFGRAGDGMGWDGMGWDGMGWDGFMQVLDLISEGWRLAGFVASGIMK